MMEIVSVEPATTSRGRAIQEACVARSGFGRATSGLITKMQLAIRQGYIVGSLRFFGIEGPNLRLNKRVVINIRVESTPLHARVLPTKLQRMAVHHGARWLIHPRARTVERGPDSAIVTVED